MTQQPQPQSRISFRADASPGARYLSGRITFDEQMMAGRLCTRYWSSSGQVWPEMHLTTVRYGVDQPADTFRLAINGQRLVGGYQWDAAQVSPDLSAYRGDVGQVTHGVISLSHPLAQVSVKVHTRVDGGPFLIRWLEITNQSAQAQAITELAPFSGLLWSQRTNEHLASPDEAAFELAYTHQFAWGQEGDFWFEPLGHGVKTVDGGKQGRSGWGRPAFWARNRLNGQTFVCELAWGGNYVYALDCCQRDIYSQQMNPMIRQAALYFAMGLASCDEALRVLEPGETVTTPAVHLGLFHEDSDAIVQATHKHVRHVVMPGRNTDIEANHRGYWCDRENEPGLIQDEDVAHAIGTEMYVIDAGWYGNEPNRWWYNTGDWHAGAWLPNGLEPVVEHAHALGMKFGLWVEVEAAGENSKLRREHPEWRLLRDGEPVARGRALDLTQPEVSAWIASEIERIIRQYKLDMFRIDHNHELDPAGNRRVAGFTEDLTWRYYEAFYGIVDRVRAKFPDVVFQDCAGGGGRLDWGTLMHFHNAELSDWMRMPRGLKILNGVTMSLPPEILLRTFGTEVPDIDLDGDVDTQLRLVCLCLPIIRGIAPSLDELSPFLKARIDHHLALYRDFIRPLMIEGRVFHHTPFLRHTELSPWCVLEYASADGARAVAGIFRTGDCAATSYHFVPRGIDAARTYQVTFDNRGLTARMSGADLLMHGLDIHLELAQSSELLLLEAV